MTTARQLKEADLRQFTGTEHWYRHPLNRSLLYTDGVKYVAEVAGAYWLVDEIALLQRYERSVAAEPFQVWKLSVSEDSSAVLRCEDGNGRAVFAKTIPYTDFPLREFTLWLTNQTMLLPGEY